MVMLHLQHGMEEIISYINNNFVKIAKFIKLSDTV
jgi:hypothetical protein